jgi:hypothetical protein
MDAKYHKSYYTLDDSRWSRLEEMLKGFHIRAGLVFL